MALFNRPRHIWGRKAVVDTAPEPLVTDALARKCILAPEAVAVLDHLPGDGEALHVVMTGRYDLMQLVVALVERIGVIEAMRVSTLSFHASNLQQMLGLLDRGQVKTLNLLACTFFRNTNKGLFVETQREFRKRPPSRVAVSRTHAKVVTFATLSGDCWTIEGSANLRHNDCWENATIVRDASVHDFHASWIDAQVTNHEGDSISDTNAG